MKEITLQKIFVFILIAACMILSAVVPMYIIILTMACLFIFAVFEKPIIPIVIYIIMAPFAFTNFLSQGMPGFKGLEIIYAYVYITSFFILVFNRKNFLPKKERIFILLYILLMIIIALRSIPYAKEIMKIPQEAYWNYKGNYYWMFYCIKSIISPLGQFLPLVLVAKLINSEDDVLKIVKGMVISLFGLSVALILIYVFSVQDKSNFEAVRTAIESIMGMHPNGLVDFYVLGFLISFAYSLREKSLFSAFTTILSVIGIGLLYSRTAYLVIIFSLFIFLFITKRRKLIFVFMVLLIISVFIMPSSIKERAMQGISDNSVSAMEKGTDISAGRVLTIWAPTIEKLLENPSDIVVGGGNYYFLTFDKVQSANHGIQHPHNAFLNTIVKAGVIGLIFMLIFYLRLVKMFKNAIRNTDNKLHQDLLIAINITILAYFIRGMTDGDLFPSGDNLFLWIILGIGLGIVKIHAINKDESYINRSSID